MNYHTPQGLPSYWSLTFLQKLRGRVLVRCSPGPLNIFQPGYLPVCDQPEIFQQKISKIHHRWEKLFQICRDNNVKAIR